MSFQSADNYKRPKGGTEGLKRYLYPQLTRKLKIGIVCLINIKISNEITCGLLCLPFQDFTACK